MNNLIFKTKTENESVSSMKKSVFKYTYSNVSQSFVAASSNCKDLEDICHKSINDSEAKKILYDLGKIITEGYYKKKKLDIIIFKSYNVFLCIICCILSCIALYFLFASVQYYPKKESDGTIEYGSLNIKNKYLKLNRTDICKDYINDLLNNKSIEIIDVNYSTSIANYNSTIPKEIHTQIKFNTTLIEKPPELDDKADFSIKFILSIILSLLSMICVAFLMFLNYCDTQTKIIPVEDIISQNFNIAIRDINKKYNEQGFSFEYFAKNKDLEITYSEVKTGFFKRKNE